MEILKLGDLRTAVIVAFVCALGGLWLGAGPAAADNTIVVNSTATTFTQGDHICSLGEAVDYADGGADSDCSAAPRSGTTTIELPAGQIEVPGTLELDLPANLVGAGAGAQRRSRSATSRSRAGCPTGRPLARRRSAHRARAHPAATAAES
jgi:hypothetical protein